MPKKGGEERKGGREGKGEERKGYILLLRVCEKFGKLGNIDKSTN